MMSVANARRLRVAINAQISETGTWGGIEQFIIGLVSALGRLGDGSEEYLIIVHRGNRDWLNPYLGANQRTILAPSSKFEFAKRLLGPFRFAVGNLLARVQSSLHRFPPIEIPLSNGFYESLGVDVVHFPHSYFVQCNLPMVCTLHDLQHLHYPQFFPPQEIAKRNIFYPAGCRAAQAIATVSAWAKQDISKQYRHRVIQDLLDSTCAAD